MTRIGAGFRSSLTARLLISLILPTAALALLLGVGGAWTIQSIVESVNDRLLDAAGRAIADTLAYEDDDVTLDLPSSAFGMLENDERDNVYYSVRSNGELVTGYPDLPVVKLPDPGAEGTAFAYSEYRGAPIRIVAIARRVPRVAQPVVVEVAETMDARNQLRWRLLTALISLEAVLIVILILLLPLAVRWGLGPLSKTRREIDRRSPTDFKPLGLEGVPMEMRGFLRAFNGLLERLDEAVEGIRRFTADASHQMRTPLSILRAHLEVIRREGLDTEAGRASLKDIEAATQRLQRLLTQLLALARAEGAKERVAAFFEPVDIVALAREVTETYVPGALKKRIDLQFFASDRSVHLRTVEALARELLANLIDNAVRYNRAGGWVRVEVIAADEGVTLRIDDDGPGIPEEARAEIFERFRRLERDQQRKGSGLGLAIVQSLAEAIGAVVTIGNREEGQGLRAEVHFATAAYVTGR